MTPIGILLTLDGDRQVEAGVKRVSGSVDLLGSSVKALRDRLGTVAGAFAGVVSVREFIQAADAVTQLENRLKLVSATAGQAAIAYDSLYQIAQRSRVSFTELGSTYASIARSASTMGVSQDRLLKVTEAIGNAVTISGSSAQASQAALVQLGQGMASGTLRGEELNSVMEQTPRLAQALADGLGIGTGELRKMGEQGAITAEKVVQALESQAAVLSGEVKNANLTVSQAMTQLGNAAVRTVGDLDKATGVSAAFASALSGLAGSITTVGEAARSHETAIKSVVGALAGGATVAAVLGVAVGVGKIGTALTALGAVLVANPAVAALLGVGAAVGGAVSLANGYNKTASGLERSLAGLRAEIARLENDKAFAASLGRTAVVDNIGKGIDERKAQIEKLNIALSSLNAGPTGTGGGRGSLNPPTVTAGAAQEAAAARELLEIRQKLYGVDKDYLPTLTKLEEQWKAGKLSQEEYVELVERLAKANFKADKSGASDAARLAKANTRSDISDLQQAYKTTAEVLANGERILDAQRQAGQISDADYYQAKRAYITSLADAEALALEQQNRILQAQKLPAAERVDADRKIAENAGKVIQLRTKASTDLALSNLQELATVKALSNAYEDARAAADQQVKAAQDRYDRELRGMGKGGNWRDINASRNQIDDQFQQRREALLADLRNNRITRSIYEQQLALVNDTNARMLDSDRNYWRERAGLQADWTVGASEAYANYLDSARNVASQTESLFSKAFTGAEDALVNFATTGKASFSSLANSIIADLIRIQIRQSMAGSGGGGLLGSLFSAGMSLLSGGSTVGSASAAYSLTTAGNYTAGGLGLKLDGARANGGGVRAGGLYEVVEEGPELLKVGGRTLLMMGGTAGVVMPATSATGASAVGSSAAAAMAGMKVEIVNSGEPAKVERAEVSTGADGVAVMKVFIAKAVEAAVGEVGSQLAGAYGPVNQGMRQRARMGIA